MQANTNAMEHAQEEAIEHTLLLLGSEGNGQIQPPQICNHDLDSLPTHGTIYDIADQSLFNSNWIKLEQVAPLDSESATNAMSENLLMNENSRNHENEDAAVVAVLTQAILVQNEGKRKAETALTGGKRPHTDNNHHGIWERNPRWPHDLYTPRWVRGQHGNREGLCSLCNPPVWLRIKQSSYWYHLNFYHGISAKTGKPWPPPREWRRSIALGQQAREALCGKCGQWIAVDWQNQAAWYRHIQKCLNK